MIFPVYSGSMHQQRNRLKHVLTASELDTPSLFTVKLHAIRMNSIGRTDNLSYQDKKQNKDINGIMEKINYDNHSFDFFIAF